MTIETAEPTSAVSVAVLSPDDGRQHNLDIEYAAGATVGELVEELRSRVWGHWPDRVCVNNAPFEAERHLVDLPLHAGAVLTAEATSTNPVAELTAIAGRDCGTTMGLSMGHYPAGTALPEPITLRMDGLQVGTSAIGWEGTFSTHGTAWKVERANASSSPAPGPVNRPPRGAIPRLPDLPRMPQRDEPSRRQSGLKWTMLLGPLLMGAVMVVLFKRPSFAIFMALGPLMLLMNWFDARRSGRKTDRLADATFKTEIASTIRRLRAWVGEAQVITNQHYPDLATLKRWPSQRHPRLWERRKHHPDFAQLSVGYARATEATLADPLLDDTLRAEIAAKVPAATMPLVIDCGPGQVVGIVGPPTASRALVRGMLMQLIAHHGPADISLQICAAPSVAQEWPWIQWLPHGVIDGNEPSIATTPEDTKTSLARPSFVVLDGVYEAALSSHVRDCANAGGTVIVISTSTTDLPAATSVIVHADQPNLRVEWPETGVKQAGTGIFVDQPTCADFARHQHVLTDPEATDGSGMLPSSVRLLDLLGMSSAVTAGTVAKRWKAAGDRLVAPIGMGVDGPLNLDIVHDGPHGLLAGTTGAGKSELLRTLVASLAATVDPDHLNFVLIDYKGGSAFDACADLPHVVGLVTDLDEHLAVRAMTCLEAELEYREHRLREAGASDLPAYLALGLAEPLPRLYLVVDEFAAMAGDLPEFMDALVDIAARGRSLGVHMMLATQRPAGVVKDTIRANTNLRISLRVQTESDSRDVLDDPAAAAVTRTVPGRGYVRFGPSELNAFQTALVTGSDAATPLQPVSVRPMGSVTQTPHETRGDTDLARLVDAIRAAADTEGFATPRTPWPPSLPQQLPLRALKSDETAITYGLIDEPSRQRQRPFGWDPSEGHLALYGMPGTGPERAAASVAAAACLTDPNASVYVMGFGTHSYSTLR